MRLQVPRDRLVSAISAVERAVSVRDTLPLLAGIRLRATTGQLQLNATDLELSLETTIPAQVGEPGDVVLEARLLSQVIRRFPPGEVQLSHAQDEGQVDLVCGSSHLSMRFQPGDDFPSLTAPEDPVKWSVKRKVFQEMIRRTIFAVSNDPSRPFLTGILVEAAADELRLVATDGNRLSLARHPWEEGESAPAQEMAVIVPARAMAELGRSPADEPAELISVEMDRRQAVFSWGGFCLTTRLVEGQFPLYRQAMPLNQRLSVVLPREPLLAAVERAALVSRTGPAFVVLQLESGLLRLTAQEADVGKVVEELAINYTDNPFQTAYQARFLSDVLKALTSENVVLGLDSALSPGTLRPEEDNSYLCVMMPVRTS